METIKFEVATINDLGNFLQNFKENISKFFKKEYSEKTIEYFFKEPFSEEAIKALSANS